jgi:hypothetical protein
MLRTIPGTPGGVSKGACNEIPTRRDLGRLLAAAILVVLTLSWPRPKPANAAYVMERFEDDFIAGNDVPNAVDPALSSVFSDIEKRPDATGKLTIGDRDVLDAGGEGGGFLPNGGNAFLDFTDGEGTFLAFHFSTGGPVIAAGSRVSFAVTGYGGDGGSLY